MVIYPMCVIDVPYCTGQSKFYIVSSRMLKSIINYDANSFLANISEIKEFFSTYSKTNPYFNYYNLYNISFYKNLKDYFYDTNVDTTLICSYLKTKSLTDFFKLENGLFKIKSIDETNYESLFSEFMEKHYNNDKTDKEVSVKYKVRYTDTYGVPEYDGIPLIPSVTFTDYDKYIINNVIANTNIESSFRSILYSKILNTAVEKLNDKLKSFYQSQFDYNLNFVNNVQKIPTSNEY